MYYFSIYKRVNMGEETVVTVRVPRELKDEMRRIDVNWSQYIRDSIQKKIDEQRIKEASDKLDQIRARTKPVSTEELLSWIREGRER